MQKRNETLELNHIDTICTRIAHINNEELFTVQVLSSQALVYALVYSISLSFLFSERVHIKV